MDPELKKLLDTIKQTYGVECATINQVLDFLNGKEGEKLTLKQQITDLENQVNTLKPFQTTATQMLTGLREDVRRLHNLTAGNTVDPLTTEIIQAAPYDKLVEMQKALAEKAEKAIPLKCQDCGSTNVNRLSSVDQPPTPDKAQQRCASKAPGIKPISFSLGGKK